MPTATNVTPTGRADRGTGRSTRLQPDRSPGPRPLHDRWEFPLLFLLLGLASFWIDLPLSAYFVSQPSGPLKQFLENGETFGDGVGVLFVLLAVAALDPLSRPLLPRMACGAWGAGLVANLVKLSVARTRPHRFDLASTNDALATFDRWFPLWTSGHGDRSFPSAHTATAFGLAILLSARYPQARALFLVFALLCGMQRVECGAHYASDVCLGAALGWIWARFCLRGPWLAPMFDQLEAPPPAPLVAVDAANVREDAA